MMENGKNWDWNQSIQTTNLNSSLSNQLSGEDSVEEPILDSTDDENHLLNGIPLHSSVIIPSELEVISSPIPIHNSSIHNSNQIISNNDNFIVQKTEREGKKKKESKRQKISSSNKEEPRQCARCGKIITKRTHCDKCRKAISRGGSGGPVGRPQKPLSEHTNPSTKLVHMLAHLNKWTGSESETKALLDLYVNKHLPPEMENERIYAQMGKSVCKFLERLPPNSTFRQPLIQAVGEGLQPHHLQQVLNLSRATLSHSLNLENNIFLTTAFNKGLIKKKKDDNDNEEGMNKRKYMDPIPEMEDPNDLPFLSPPSLDQSLLLNQLSQHPLQLPNIPPFNLRENGIPMESPFLIPEQLSQLKNFRGFSNQNPDSLLESFNIIK